MGSFRFFIEIFRPHYFPAVDSTSNRNDCQGYLLQGKDGRCVGLTTSPPCADFLDIWEPQPSGPLWVCPCLYRDCFTSSYSFLIYSAPLSTLTPRSHWRMMQNDRFTEHGSYELECPWHTDLWYRVLQHTSNISLLKVKTAVPSVK